MGYFRYAKDASLKKGHTDKKENIIFLIYRKFRWGSCKVIYEEGLPNI
jgi:hypothetical protein